MSADAFVAFSGCRFFDQVSILDIKADRFAAPVTLANVKREIDFNSGANHPNHRIVDLAEIAAHPAPASEVQVRALGSTAQRTYKADFGNFARTFRFRWDAGGELYAGLKTVDLILHEYLGKTFARLRWLSSVLESGMIDARLRLAGILTERR